jgi:TolA-binding protein
MMKVEIQKLKKRLLREELRDRKKNFEKYHPLVVGTTLFFVLFLGGFFFISDSERIPKWHFARGEALLEEGEYDKAIGIFRHIYERYPGCYLSPQALFQSGDILNLYLKRYHEALLAYLLVEKDYPNSDLCRKAQQRTAEIYKYRLQDYDRAIVAYQKLLDEGVSQGDKIQYEVGDTYFRLNNFEQAGIEFESLLKNYPASPLVPEVRYRIGVAFFLEGALEKAESAFLAVTEEWPDSPYASEAWFSLATVLEEREELKEALEILEDLRGGYPNTEVLAKKIEQIKERIRKKKKAI